MSSGLELSLGVGTLKVVSYTLNKKKKKWKGKKEVANIMTEFKNNNNNERATFKLLCFVNLVKVPYYKY